MTPEGAVGTVASDDAPAVGLTRLPIDWRTATLREFLAEPIRNGYSPVCPTEPTGKWILSLSAVSPQGFDSTAVKPAPASDPLVDAFLLRPGDFLVSRSNTRERVGLSAVFRGEVENCAYPDLLMRFRLDGAELLADFLEHYLTSSWARGYLQRHASGTSASMVKINRSVLESLPIPVPPLPEQRRIASILTSVDDAIAATRAVIEQTRKVKQGLLQRLMTRGIGHTRFKMTEIGSIPARWQARRLDELGEVCGGRQRSPHLVAGRPRRYLRVANVYDGEIDVSDVLEMAFTEAEFERYRLHDGDILLNEGQSLELVGRSAIYRGLPADCCYQNTLIRFRVGADMCAEYFQALFQWYLHRGCFSEVATQTTSIAHLGVSRFGSLLAPVPPLEEQARIASMVSDVDRSLCLLGGSAAGLARLKSAVMSDLLTGRVRVGGAS